jgi:hypothetical protein
MGIIYKKLYCPYCNHPHNDEDKVVDVLGEDLQTTIQKNFGKQPHRKHYCYSCEKIFIDPNNEKSISKH